MICNKPLLLLLLLATHVTDGIRHAKKRHPSSAVFGGSKVEKMTEDFGRYVRNYCLRDIAKMHKYATRRLTTATWRTSTGMIIPFKGAQCHTVLSTSPPIN